MTIDVRQTLRDVRRAHHTNKYKTNALIVRRGFSVRLATDSTRLSAVLTTVRRNRKLQGSYRVTVSADAGTDDKGWTLSSSGSGEVDLYVPVSAKVGLYALYEDENTSDSVALVVLFNPYSRDDSVYLSDGSQRREYIQNESGRIWRGSYNSFSGSPWVYAQFRTRALLAALDLVDRMPVSDRESPIMVSRYLSALINSSDRDNGVIVGKWSGDYSDGVSPTAWTGSYDILSKYWTSGGRPVRYGQCWVFAGVFNSVLRTLGIPSMVVSNFSSAHERKPYNRVIEKYYNTQGEPIPERSMGSTWNFHVWNMVWMTRPDLQRAARSHALDYNGWQVVDATPQEQSMGMYQLGPCPVVGVKHGFKVDFDADFVIGEVNADMAYYVQRGQRFDEFRRNRRQIGKSLSVKQVGRDSRQDVTSWYKFREGTAEERQSFRNRRKGSSIAPRSFSLPTGDQPATPDDEEADNEQTTPIAFQVNVPAEIVVGQDVTYSLSMSSHVEREEDTQVTYTVKVKVHIEGTDYTGQSVGVIKQQSYVTERSSSSVDPESLTLDLTADDYESLLSNGMQTIHVDTVAIASIKDSDNVVQTWNSESLVRINVDDILTARFDDSVDVRPDENGRDVAYVSLDDELTVVAVINNVSHTTLSSVVLRVEGEGITKINQLTLDDFQVGEQREIQVACKATQAGDRLLVMTLDSAEIMDVSRSMHVVVEEDEDGATVDDEEIGWDGEESEVIEDMVELSAL